ncbi:MAG: HD domain-containing protein [Bdellovibrionaceae bacterium]|nr:HD domain-containing protein [Pseudobdellovibrionaceae bacterium]
MELRDPIHGSINITDVEKEVIDSLVFQRLRAIKQLGFSELSFPGATHNRMIHSIGVSHLAGRTFNQIFQNFEFPNNSTFLRLQQTLRLAALLHDVGHGPLSHTTEEVMPRLKDLNIAAYNKKRTDLVLTERHYTLDRQANHEDYTIKFITDSSLTPILKSICSDIEPIHIACLIDKTLACPDDFFKVKNLDFRSILSQIVSSELDCDRMDYLERDAYFCGTNYGRVELSWLIANLTYHIVDDNLYLALNRRALYAFDDFLLARHHMHLMVYFHHKSIIYEEMLNLYLTSEDCEFYLPSSIDEYIRCTDYALYQHLDKVKNPWAQRIAQRNPYKVLFELHTTHEDPRPVQMKKFLENEGIKTILAGTMARLSKYHTAAPEEKSFPIFVVDQYDRLAKPYPIEESTEIFHKYEEIRRIERLYVEPESYDLAEKIIIDKKL